MDDEGDIVASGRAEPRPPRSAFGWRLRRTRAAGVARRVRDAFRLGSIRLGVPHAADPLLARVHTLLRRPRPRVSVIIPTVGREALARAIASASWAHEVIVVFDAANVPAGAPADVRVLACGPSGHLGAEQRMLGMANATGTHLAFLDDDDEYTPEARDVVPHALTARPGRVHIFRMRNRDRVYGGYGCVWDGGIGSPMFVVPNDGATGEWTARYQGDFDVIRSTLARRRRGPRFHQEVIAVTRPHEVVRS